VVERDFVQMAAHGLNAVRVYTAPPRWLLDTAQEHGLRVMVDLPWEEHIVFLDDRNRVRAIEERVRAGVRACAGHPGVLCYAIGNEIPASIVRWCGPHRVERYVEKLYNAAKAEDPDGLVTYVNYPSTEYLQLPFLDVVCFNVYLEARDRFEAYLARLQNLAGDRPLILTEVGLDSRRHGEEVQARVLDWQVQTAFAAGCAGVFVFAWTDEWYRGGHEIEDWEFGLTRRDRQPKPALAVVREAFANVPFRPDLPWPRISVVVCVRNGARTIRACLEGLQHLEYSNYEVIVVDDGSTDGTAAIATHYPVCLIRTEQRGLGSARNVGLDVATGEIVAYIDSDARPDRHWLTYLAATFLHTEHAGVGGPNIAPPGDGITAECVAKAPGRPTHVLLCDREAEHLPGCNMAFRKLCLHAIGGFGAQYVTAGDDVDVCWRLQRDGATLGFSPGAMAWHHHRTSVRAYWRQQQGYGRAEALLERSWPEKYNAFGNLTWAGRVYGGGLTPVCGWRRGRIYHGVWGSAAYQALYQPASSLLWSLPAMPEWYGIMALLAGLSALGEFWTPLRLARLLLGFAVLASCAQAGVSAARAAFPGAPRSWNMRLTLRAVTALLHILQPLARLHGRWCGGLTPWRRRGVRGFRCPRRYHFALWRERWQAPAERLRSLEAVLRADRAAVLRGDDFKRWDLEVRDGTLAGVRILMAVEEHGAGRQLARFHAWPICTPAALTVCLGFAVLAVWAAVDRAWEVSTVLGATAGLLTARTILECGAATAAVCRAFGRLEVMEEQRVAPAVIGKAVETGE